MSYSERYGYTSCYGELEDELSKIIEGSSDIAGRDVLLKCFSFMDLTTLHSDDTEEAVRKLVGKVNGLKTEYPDYPLPASICVYPNFAETVRKERNSDDIHVTTVASCFPSAQSFLEVKVRECELAVENGADEVDIVLALNSFLAGDEERAAEEIRTMKEAIDRVAAEKGRKVILKVILETGLLKTEEKISEASFLAMEAGADFIKTSTGKVDVNATPASAYIMCKCIRKYYEVTGKKVGFKAAGGISDDKDALCYYCIGLAVLGHEWMNKNLFRFGVSRLGNKLMGAIEQQTINYF